MVLAQESCRDIAEAEFPWRRVCNGRQSGGAWRCPTVREAIADLELEASPTATGLETYKSPRRCVRRPEFYSSHDPSTGNGCTSGALP